MGLVDEGGDHVHVIRNEGSVEARTVAVQFIPAGATRRIVCETCGRAPSKVLCDGEGLSHE